jgi:signal peptidase I
MAAGGITKTVLRIASLGVFGTVFIVAVLLSGWLGWWRLQGKTVLSVESNSMVPTFQRGDAVIVDSTLAKRQIGQVVSFQSTSGDDVIISHRLIAADDRRNQYVTQGDALNTPDAALHKEAMVGTVTGVLPGFGVMLQFMRSPMGLTASVYAPCSWLLYHELRRAANRWTARPYLLRHWRAQTQRH